MNKLPPELMNAKGIVLSADVKIGAYNCGAGNTVSTKNGALHSEDGPALIAGKNMLYLQNGVEHRVGGPAVVHADGSKEWRQNGKTHRADGPAFEGANGNREFWLNGVEHALAYAVVKPSAQPDGTYQAKVVAKLAGKTIERVSVVGKTEGTALAAGRKVAKLAKTGDVPLKKAKEQAMARSGPGGRGE